MAAALTPCVSPICEVSNISAVSSVCEPLGDGVAQLRGVDGVTIYGPPPENGRAALCSFNVEGLHASDVSTLLDHEGGLPLPLDQA